jgi:hypothetical protein
MSDLVIHKYYRQLYWLAVCLIVVGVYLLGEQ